MSNNGKPKIEETKAVEKVFNPEDVDAIIEKIELSPESVLIITIPNDITPEIMQTIFHQFAEIAEQWGKKLNHDEPISFIVCTIDGVVLGLNEKNPYVTIKELKDLCEDSYEAYLKVLADKCDTPEGNIHHMRQSHRQEIDEMVSFTLLDDISEHTLYLRKHARGIEHPKWNPDKDQYEFWSGITAEAQLGILGLAPEDPTIKSLGLNLETVDFRPDWKTVSHDRLERPDSDDGEAGFTDAETIAIADMMIKRWKQFRNARMTRYAETLAAELEQQEADVDEC